MMTSDELLAETSVQFQKNKAKVELTALHSYRNLLVKFNSYFFSDERNPKIHICVYIYAST